VPPSLTEALSWLNKAAQADEPAAQNLLAALALQGIAPAAPKGLFASASPACASPDYPQALHWAERAVRNGSVEAQALLGFIRTSGPEEMRDPAEGERLYRAAAEAGNAQGKLGCAMALLRRFNEASAHLKQAIAIDANVAERHNNFGVALSGLGKFDEAAAAFRHAIAIRPDYADAHGSLSNCLLTLGDLHQGFQEYRWR
jgi:TPR repeat protein